MFQVNPNNFRTIIVSENAARLLLRKHPFRGRAGGCERLCNDGNICTIDNPLGYDCEADGCLPLESRKAIGATMEMSALSIRAALRRDASTILSIVMNRLCV
jgi:hypothetical protein